MIYVYFYLASGDRDNDPPLLEAELPQVPGVGEAVHLSNVAYLVESRRWLVDGPGKLRAIVRVLAFQKQELNDRRRKQSDPGL